MLVLYGKKFTIGLWQTSSLSLPHLPIPLHLLPLL
jgi:hypothetical protein